MGRISNAYSKALFNQAKSTAQIDKIYQEMTEIITIISENSTLKNLLANPIVKGTDKKKVLEKVFNQNNPLTKNLLGLLCDKKRENELFQVAESFIKMYDQHKGISKVFVTSAIALDEGTQQKVLSYIQKTLGKENIVIANKIDSSIIGGIIIKHEDKLLDLSVSSELKRIRKEIIYN
jgi:F-type H+-transporting ATPase subunit delta